MKKLIIALMICMALPYNVAYAQTVNNQYDADKAKAKSYLQEQGVEIPNEVEFWAEYYGERYGICPEVLEAVCWVESRCTQDAQSPDKSCKGLMQIKPACHTKRMQRLNALNVFGISDNIKIGADYLTELGGNEDIAVALTIYNGQSEAKIEKARNGEYSGYVKNILEISEALERVNNK